MSQAATINDPIEHLRAEIESGLIVQDLGWLQLEDPPPELPRFAPIKLAKEILRPELTKLFRAISEDKEVDNDVSIAIRQPDTFRILAILLCIRCTKHTLNEFRIKIIRNYESSVSDKDLPITEETARHYFGEFGLKFYRRQFEFCAVILKEHEVVECTGRATSFRLPFYNNEVLGEGSSGKVIKVKVPPGHFQFGERSRGTNKTAEAFACKVFQSNDTKLYRQELKILDFIRKSVKGHQNVMLGSGSLLVQNTCILYFEVADGGDLHNYFLTQATIPRSASDIISFLRRCHSILDALAFLHEDLIKPENQSEEWRFAHLDLRPANILVFRKSASPDNEIWKIHDFGISKVKKAAKGDEVKGWRKMFQSHTEDLTTSGTLRARDSTTFLAPEYKNVFTIGEMSTVTSKADIWSFGCIMSVGLSFLIDGPRSVKDFSQRRKDRAGVEDVFFVREEKRIFRPGKPRINLNPAVSEYFSEILSYIENGECDHLQPTFQKITAFLKRKTLAPVAKARVTAKEGAKLLNDILENLERPKDESSKVGTDIWGRNKPAPDPTQESTTFELNQTEGSKSCKFSSCGKYLAYFSTNSIAFCETVLIFRGGYAPGGKEVRQLKPPAEFKWRGFDINSKYLVAYTDATYFDCHIYPHLAQSNPGVSTGTPVHYRLPIRDAASIHFAALSPDPSNGLLVTALKSDDQRYHIYLSEVSDMVKYHDYVNGGGRVISIPATSTALAPNYHTDQNLSISTSRTDTFSRTSQAASSRSSDFQSLPQLPWENSLLHSAEMKKNSNLKHIHSMQFSADAKIFTVLSQPPKANELTWYCWDTTLAARVKARIGEYNRQLEAKADAHQVWMTAFIPLMPEPSLMFITHQSTIMRRSFSKNKNVDWSTQRLKIPLFHILPFNNESDKHFIFIGREKGSVKALYAPNSKAQRYDKVEELHFDFILDLDCQDWVVGRDAATHIEDGMEFLIARPAKGGRLGFARKIYRPRAPRPAKQK